MRNHRIVAILWIVVGTSFSLALTLASYPAFGGTSP